MLTIICTNKNCGKDFEVDETVCIKEKFIQCPNCRNQTSNPLYTGEK